MSEIGGTVTVFRNVKGTLKKIQVIASDSVGGEGGADIHLTPDGRFLYSSNRLKADGIAIFKVDAQNGKLKKVGYQDRVSIPEISISRPTADCCSPLAVTATSSKCSVLILRPACSRIYTRIFILANRSASSLLPWAVNRGVMLMSKKEINPEYLTCPIRQVISRFGDKWSMLVLYTLLNSDKGVMRFSEIRDHMTDCSQKMLSKTLKDLQTSHLVDRKVYPEVPPRVEYWLTETGQSLIPAIEVLIGWAKQHFDEIVRP